jgi:PAS domain-containing protein
MTQLPSLLQLLSDARIGALFAAPKPAFVLDREGGLLFANQASLALLRAGSRREAEAAIAAERGPFAAALRGLSEEPAGSAPQMHTLPLKVGGVRRAIQFACSRIEFTGDGSAILLAGLEPAGSAPAAVAAATAAFGDEQEAFALFAADGKKIYANAAASNLIGGASGLTEIIPGSQNALAKARSEGHAELGFGVLRILLRRIGVDADPFVAAAFTAPARPEANVEVAPAPRSEVKLSAPAAEPDSPTEAKLQPIAPAENMPTSELSSEQKTAERTPAPEQTIAREAETPPEVAPPEPAETPKEPPRLPSRFVWQTDTDGRFTSVSPELAMVVGSAAARLRLLSTGQGVGSRRGRGEDEHTKSVPALLLAGRVARQTGLTFAV